LTRIPGKIPISSIRALASSRVIVLAPPFGNVALVILKKS
jgi:hypothetical protein